MPLRPTDLPPGVLFARAELLRRGAHERLLASSAFTRVLPGYYMRTDTPAPLLAIAGTLQTGIVPNATVSHATAGELLGIPLPRTFSRQGGALLHCRSSEPSWAGRANSCYVVHRGGEPALRCRIAGVLMSHPVLVLQELSPGLRHDDLVVGLDAVISGKGMRVPAVPREAVQQIVENLRGRGAAALRKAFADAAENVWSPMETRVRLLLIRSGFGAAVANLEVRDPVTGQLFYIDLGYPFLKIAIEYDSEEHRTNRRQWQRDLHKDEVLHQLGWVVLRISIADVVSPQRFLHRLSAAIERAQAVLAV